MFNFKILGFLFTIIIILSGCAATYKPINPRSVTYYARDIQGGIDFSYKYDVLREAGNRKYANKEIKRNVKVVAIKITNYTDSTINVRDLVFYSGQNPITPLEPMVVKQLIRQIVPAYLPYALLTFTTLTFTKTNSTGYYQSTESHSYPIGIILGPAVTIGNMAVAGSANKKLFAELYEYNILQTEIPKGETRYGIIGIRDVGFNPISVKVRQ